MNPRRKLPGMAIALVALVTAAVAAAPSAEAHRFWRPWFGFAFPAVYAPPPPVYVVPRVAYYVPPPPPPAYYGYRYRVVHRYYRVRHVHRVVHRTACSCACCPK